MSFTVEEVAQQAGVSLSYLERQLSGHHVLSFARYCAPLRVVGIELGLERCQLDDINEDQRKNTLRRRGLLEVWKEKCTFEATYSKFVKALVACEKNDSAYQVCLALAEEEGIFCVEY